jgi:hypothetical protein
MQDTENETAISKKRRKKFKRSSDHLCAKTLLPAQRLRREGPDETAIRHQVENFGIDEKKQALAEAASSVAVSRS